jgi:outer membrane translocation and assembly module TamA
MRRPAPKAAIRRTIPSAVVFRACGAGNELIQGRDSFLIGGERTRGSMGRMNVWLALALGGLSGCAGVERGRYGVDALRVEGMDALNDKALRACLLTRERESWSLVLGVSEPSCGRPPFDSASPALRLWRWPWTEWPSFNQAVFDKDLERVVRWYRARGYYAARVVSVRYDPPEAATPGARGECDPNRDDCTVSVFVTIDEGAPTTLASLEVVSRDPLPPELELELHAQLKLEPGQPVDESLHEANKAALSALLRRRGYAAAKVEGRVEIDTRRHQARVTYELAPGPVFHFGGLTVSGHGALPARVIEAAAGLRRGAPYDPDTLREVESEVFALGAFSAVQVVEKVDAENAVVDLEVVVTPLGPHALRVGFGVLSGANQRTETGELQSIPQWDLHLFGRYERRHVFDSLGRFGIDDRARLIFSQDFPRPTTPTLGNVLGLSFNQPGLLEPRTDLFARAVWDRGPDTFLGYPRSDIFFRVGARRSLFVRGLFGTLALQQDIFLVDDGAETSTGEEPPVSYAFAYLEQDVRLDLRNDPVRTTRGAYLALNATEAVRSPVSDWTAFRLAPEARGYVPLPFSIVVAARFGIAGLFIENASPELDPESQQLGPTTYRLRGGGANSNRGFLAGDLGVGKDGGVRRWESSLELRVPFGSSLVVAGFADVGDVNDTSDFRFSHWNTTLGFGFRYYTIIGALRLDLGYRVASLQRADGSRDIEPVESYVPFSDIPGALHLTIGDPF